MSFFTWGNEKTPKEAMREHRRTLERSMREIDRERAKMEAQERQTIVQIKNAAKSGQMTVARAMAKDLVRTRNAIIKFVEMRGQLQAVSTNITQMSTIQTMTEAMRGVSRAMSAMNQSLNMPELAKTMANFEKQGQIMEMKQEMMGDTIDSVIECDETEQDEVVDKVLDELALGIGSQLSSTNTATPAASRASLTTDKHLAALVMTGSDDLGLN